jgi:hypothetical protein
MYVYRIVQSSCSPYSVAVINALTAEDQMSGASSSTTAAGCADLLAMSQMIKQAQCVLLRGLQHAAETV